MSNPGVLTLTKKQLSARKNFRVEDNLGESVHFHYNDIRVDLTMKELLAIADQCDAAIYDLIPAKDFKMEDFDGDFLNSYSQCLIDLEGVEKVQVPVSGLYIQDKGFLGLPTVRKVRGARLASGERVIDKENHDVVLFNESPVVMYGTACCKEGNISAIRLRFRQGKYSVGMHPWIQFLFCWDKKRVWNLLKRIYDSFNDRRSDG